MNHKGFGGFSGVELKSGDGRSRAVVLPDRGGITASFRVDGREMLYLQENSLEILDEMGAGGMPVLFPTSGRLARGRYRTGEKEYLLPIHSFGRMLPWQVREVREDAVTLALPSSSWTMAFYPFPFEVQSTWTLEGSGLTLRQRYVNRGGESMPVAAGFHPYFRVGDKTRLSFGIPAEGYRDYTEGKDKEYRGVVDFSHPVDFVFPIKGEYRCTMTDPDLGRRVVLEAGSPYRYMVLWTQEGKDFVCMEPWMGAPDAFNTGEGLQWVERGETLESWIRIGIETLDG